MLTDEQWRELQMRIATALGNFMATLGDDLCEHLTTGCVHLKFDDGREIDARFGRPKAMETLQQQTRTASNN